MDGHSFVEISLEPNFAKKVFFALESEFVGQGRKERAHYSPAEFGPIKILGTIKIRSRAVICRITSLVMLGTVCSSAPGNSICSYNTAGL